MERDRAGSSGPERGVDDAGAERPDFIDQVIDMVRAIPPGRVMTYGDIATVLTARAERAGLAESYGPRMVGYVMSRFGGTLPWWRVIRSTGHPPRCHQDQAWPRYRAEGTPLIGRAESYRIDLRRARFHPEWPGDLEHQGASCPGGNR